MRTVVIGWGSLIWCPGSLRLATRWHRDGPRLPIEFARISEGGRLTLVIHPGVPPQPTFWAVHGSEDLKTAIENLRGREGTIADFIGRAVRSASPTDDTTKTVRAWLSETEYDAAIWTALPSNWEEKREGRPFSISDAVSYLTWLPDKSKAEEYVRNAPDVLQTQVRRLIERGLGWTPHPLSDVLFADSP